MEDKFAGKSSSARIKETYLKSLGESYGEFTLGENTTRILLESPRNLLFNLARYKFVTKMFDGFKNVLEVGCQEGFGAHLVSGGVDHLDCLDFYHPYIDSCCRRINSSKIKFFAHDMLDSPVLNSYDGIFALDVLEHIEKEAENQFIENICESLGENGSLIIGMPSIESQKYASKSSKIGHVNCKNMLELKEFMQTYFSNVFTFGMNDEVLHTGYPQMSHYVLALCCSLK
tara:strand:+ start:952 stop:1641 length:690 start_codon:yes stop_codon:yes gene_type:complete